MIKDVGKRLVPILKNIQHSAFHIASVMPVPKKSSLKSLEILIKLINSGFDIELINHIRENLTITVIASPAAGKVEHFSEVFEKTDVEAALAAGSIFHREEVPIEAVKDHMRDKA